MKKSILLTLSIVCLFFTSCGSDDNEINIGSTTSFKVVVDDLKGEINEGTVTLDGTKTYTLTGPLIVKSGAVLNIPEGTKIESSVTAESTSLYIAVERDALINITGTSTNPVVMTSGKDSPSQSDWGGLVICGNGIANTGPNGTSEVAGLSYGGNDNADSSGKIEYLKIEYTGAKFSSSKEFNGISFFAVGSGTMVSNVYAYESGDDAVEFFGGAVDASNIVLINAYDDSLDFADGYVGRITNAYIKGITKAGVEGSNNGSNDVATPLTDVKLVNFSIVKGDGFGASEQAIFFKEGGGKQEYTNLFVEGIETACKLDSGTGATTRINAGDFKVINYEFTTISPDLNGAIFSGTTTATGAGSRADLPTWAEWIN